MSVPRVFHSKTRLTNPWGVRYRASETTDWFPKWEDAMTKALTWSEMSQRAADETRRLIRQEEAVERILARGESS